MNNGLTGSIAAWPLTDVLAMLANGAQTGHLEVVAGQRTADVFIRDGAIVHAAEGALSGEEALLSLATWPEGTFTFRPKAETMLHTITRTATSLLDDCRRVAEEAQTIRAAIPSLDAVPRMATVPPEAPVTLRPHEWALLASLSNGLTVRELSGHLGQDEATILRVLYRLVEGKLVDFGGRANVTPIDRGQAGGASAQAAQPARPRVATVPPAFFDRLTSAAQAFLGPVTSLVIDEEMAGLETTRDTMTLPKASALVERVAMEMRDANDRGAFTRTMVAELRALNASAAA